LTEAKRVPPERFVVLPTLHELPPDEVAAACSRPLVNRLVHSACTVAAVFPSKIRRTLSTRKSLLRRHRDGSLHLIVDLAAKKRTFFSLSPEELNWLEQCRLEPQTVADLHAMDRVVFDKFVRNGFLVPQDIALRNIRPRHFEIEINRHCNWRCVFCPVSQKPKPKQLMTEELFRLLLQRVVDYGAESISLHFYGEPLIHPKAIDWIQLAVESGLRVDLYTNASLLNEDKVKRIAAIGNTYLTVNLPSVDAEEFRRVTGTKLLDRSIANLKLAHRYKVPVSLVINAPRESRQETIGEINAMFEKMFGKSVEWRTTDRAGNLDAPNYASATTLTGKLSGCSLMFYQAVVSYEGKLLPCCQDYDQEWEWGDITKDSIDDVLESENAMAFKRWVMGLEDPPENFLCSRCDQTSTLGASGRVLTVGTQVFNSPILAGFHSRISGSDLQVV